MRTYERVREYIDDNQLVRENVAFKAGIPIAELDAILSGDKTLYADELRSICLALQVSPEQFLDCVNT